MSRDVLILNIDAFAKKNVMQIRELEAEGWTFTIVANDLRANSRQVFDAQGFARSRLILLKGSIAKLTTAWRVLRERRYHHVEFYAVSHLSIPYLIMLKLLRQKFLVVERGDISVISGYNPVVRAGMKLAYRLADLILYKEVYMAEPLRRLCSTPLAMVPNCVDERPVADGAARDIDFLWVNRIIPQRRAEWATAAMADERLADRSLLMLGLEERATLESDIANGQERLRAAAGRNIELRGFLDPEPLYRRARYFCLPSTIVFGNNSMLEAMAAGVVPVVTEAPGVELIVEDGVNGIITPFDREAYREGVVRAAALGDEQWRAMSRKAVETVREKYSPQAWTSLMSDVYARIGAA
jgi:glycosyltransferase involved in cell wall biosynthesis